MKSRKAALGLLILLAASFAFSFIHPWGDLRRKDLHGSELRTQAYSILNGSAVPDDVRQVLETKCGDCHSNNTRWPAYSWLAPGSWLMEHDVHAARQHLNLSDWPLYDADRQIDLLNGIAAKVRKGEMPLPHYLLLHPGARLTEDERKRINLWAKTESKRIRTETAQR